MPHAVVIATFLITTLCLCLELWKGRRRAMASAPRTFGWYVDAGLCSGAAVMCALAAGAQGRAGEWAWFLVGLYSAVVFGWLASRQLSGPGAHDHAK